jgi:hypothetical protein
LLLRLLLRLQLWLLLWLLRLRLWLLLWLLRLQLRLLLRLRLCGIRWARVRRRPRPAFGLLWLLDLWSAPPGV